MKKRYALFAAAIMAPMLALAGLIPTGILIFGR